MRAARRLPAAAALAAAALPCASAAAATTPAEPAHVPGVVLVGFEDGTTAGVRADALRAQGLPVPGDLGRREALRLRVEDGRLAGRSVAEVADALRGEPGVRFAEPNWRYRAQVVPDDPGFGSLWGLQSIRAPAAWDITTGTPGVTVAVVDSGVATGHPDLAPNLVGGWDFVGASWPSCAGGGPDVSDGDGHGTHVAGILGARGNDATGVAGVAWGARIMPVRALGADGSGTSSAVACAFAYAGRMGARVVNASLGGEGYSQAIADAVAGAPETLFVVAAGNDAVDVDASPRYPCALPAANVICVAATDQADGLASFSNIGAASVDLGAPGRNILSDAAAHVVAADLPPSGAWTFGGAPLWGLETVPWEGATLSDSPGGSYPPNAAGVAASSPFSLAGRSGCRLTYRLRLATQSGVDLLWVETSNGGPWTAIDTLSGSTQGAFEPLVADLSALDGAPSGQVRFGLTSNGTIEGDGANVAAPRVECLPTSYTGQELRFASGTSMAAPHVAGAAALLLSQTPSLSAAQVKARLLTSVDPLPALAGRTVSGGRLNVRAALESQPGVGFGLAVPAPVAPAAPAAPVAVPPLVGDRLAPRLTRLVARPGRGRVVLTFRLDERATVAVEAQATRRPKRAVRRVKELASGGRRMVIAPLAPGRYRVRLVARDAAGNRRAVARRVSVPRP